MLPALPTRNSTLPAFASRTARPMSNVTVPSLGFGMRPRGPSTLPSRPTCPMRSGVAMVVSNSMKPPWTFSTRSSAPTTSAPASRASRSFSPLAKTATRTVLPMPFGSTTAPRTIWSACLGSTPRRNERSTDSSNFAAGIPLSVAMASSTEYGFSRSTFAAAASYRLLTTVLIIVSLEPFSPLASAVERPQLALRGVRRLALHDIDAHAAGGALDDPHRGVDGVRVEVHQLGLRDLAPLLLRDLADLVLVRHRRRLRDARRALEQHGRRRRLHDEGEGPVLVDGHDDRYGDLHPPALGVDVLHRALEVDEGSVDDTHLVAALEHRLGLGLLGARLHVAQDLVDLVRRERDRLVAGADEARELRRAAHEVPRVVGQLHLHQHVAREELLLGLALLLVADLD